MVGYANVKAELDAIGASIAAASVDPLDRAREVAEQVNFPVGHGVTRAIAGRLGSWWEDRRQIIQPSEFVLGPDNRVVVSSYSDGPLGRIDAADVVKLINFYESRS